jgi:hypothetical protein
MVTVMLIEAGSLTLRDGSAPARAFAPGLAARLRAWSRARALDRALAAGSGADGSSALALRAARLTSPRTRARVADDVERLLAAAEAPPSPRRIGPCRAVVAAAAEQLRETAALLRGPTPVYARGIAMLTLLLSDGTGPAYAPAREGAFPERLQEARAALLGD